MSKVLIIGGTHGNEWTGVYLVNQFAEELKTKFPHLSLQFIHANPRAFDAKKRFCDEDLNRVFEFINLNTPHDTYEYRQGLAIHKEIQVLKPDWIIDLHTTTSSLGSTLIIAQNHVDNFKLAGAIEKELPEVKTIYAPDPNRKYLLSQSQRGLMIEVGPIANNTLNPITLLETKKILETILGLIQSQSFLTNHQMHYFEEVKDIFYPTKNGEIAAMIHPTLQGQDFIPLKKNSPLFLHFDHSISLYNEEDGLFPIFINEAAYYPAKLAFSLCKKREWKT